jgi:hypothetical protein
LAVFGLLALLGALALNSTMTVAALLPMLTAGWKIDELDVMPYDLLGQPGDSAPPPWPLRDSPT